MPKTRGGYSNKCEKRIQESNRRNTNECNNIDVGRRMRHLPDTNNNSSVDLGLEDFQIPDQPLDFPVTSPRPASSHTESFTRTAHTILSNHLPRRVRTGRGLNPSVRIPPRGSNKLEIYIQDGSILSCNKPPRVIGRICKNYVNGPWYQWSEVKKPIRDLMFKDFKIKALVGTAEKRRALQDSLWTSSFSFWTVLTEI